jgi:hypothetical protein
MYNQERLKSYTPGDGGVDASSPEPDDAGTMELGSTVVAILSISRVSGCEDAGEPTVAAVSIVFPECKGVGGNKLDPEP